MDSSDQTQNPARDTAQPSYGYTPQPFLLSSYLNYIFMHTDTWISQPWDDITEVGLSLVYV